MKKLLYLLSFIMILMMLPFGAANAKTLQEETRAQYLALVKQKRQVIKQKIKQNKLITSQINKKSKQVADIYDLLFKENMVPNDEKIMQIEAKEMEITRVIQKILQIEKGIERYEREIELNLKQNNFKQALLKLDKLVSMMETEHDLLKEHHETLSKYMEFLQSMRLK
jgi:hypothetical protein